MSTIALRNKTIPEKSWQIWLFFTCFWAVATLSFMAGMSIAGGFFIAFSLACVFLYPHGKLFVFFRHLSFTHATYFLLFVSLFSLVANYFSPPLGLPAQGYGGLLKFQYFLLPFLLCFALVTGLEHGVKIEKHRLWPAMDLMAAFVSLIGIFQFFSPSLLPESWMHGSFFRPVAWGGHCHAQGLMMFHLSFASAMCFPAAYSLARFFWRNPEEKKSTWIRHGVLALLCLNTVFFTYSRIAWVAVFALVVVLGFLRKPKLGLLLTVALAVLATGLWFGSRSLRDRMQDNGFGARERIMVWRASLEMIQDRPLVGVGFGKTGEYSDAYSTKAFGAKQTFASHSHNNLMDAFASTGILGLIAYLWWWGMLFFYSWRQFQAQKDYLKWLPAACLAAGVAFQINGLTQVNFFDAKSEHAMVFWAGLVLAQEWQRRKASSTT